MDKPTTLLCADAMSTQRWICSECGTNNPMSAAECSRCNPPAVAAPPAKPVIEKPAGADKPPALARTPSAPKHFASQSDVEARLKIDLRQQLGRLVKKGWCAHPRRSARGSLHLLTVVLARGACVCAPGSELFFCLLIGAQPNRWSSRFAATVADEYLRFLYLKSLHPAADIVPSALVVRMRTHARLAIPGSPFALARTRSCRCSASCCFPGLCVV